MNVQFCIFHEAIAGDLQSDQRVGGNDVGRGIDFNRELDLQNEFEEMDISEF
jgi:hypothetical protein